MSAAVSIIGVILIMVIVLLFATKSSGKIFDDKRGETELAVMGVRNAIVHISLLDNGKTIYKMPGNGEYSVEIDDAEIRVQYAGQTLPDLRPEITIQHYTPQVKPAALTGSELCIVARKYADAECVQAVEVCLPNQACCSSAFEETVC